MTYQSWDQRFKDLEGEIKTLHKKQHGFLADKFHAEIKQYKQKIYAMQTEMDQYLSYVFSASSSSGFFSPNDKAMIHWSMEMAKKISEFYQSYLQSVQVSFWARIVHLLGMGLGDHTAENINDGNQLQILREHRSRMISSQASLEKQSHIFMQKRAMLTRRYEQVLVAKSNFDTAKLLGQKEFAPKNRNLWLRLAQPFAMKKASLGAQNEEKKLSSLSLRAALK